MTYTCFKKHNFLFWAQQAIKRNKITTTISLTIWEVDNDDDDGCDVVMKYFVMLLLADNIMLK